MVKICLNMIVKNERHVIERCLNSIKDFIDDWIIVDTGSTDGTQDAIRSVLGEVPGEIHERPWVNFEWNRNEALKLAIGRADYILVIDADDFLIGKKIDKSSLLKDSYYVKAEFRDRFFYKTLLIRNDSGWQWKGLLDESLWHPRWKDAGELPGVVLKYSKEGARLQDPARTSKDLKLLEEAIRSDPNDFRSMYSLANLYSEMGEFDAALRHYQQVLTVDADAKERFGSLFGIARMQNWLGANPWHAIESYFKAYECDSKRPEPLLEMIDLFIEQKNAFLGYLVSKFAIGSVFAPNAENGQRAEDWVCDYGFLLRFVRCAIDVGKEGEAQDAMETLLQRPDLPAAMREDIEEQVRRRCKDFVR